MKFFLSSQYSIIRHVSTYSDDINITVPTYLTTLSVTEIQRSTSKMGRISSISWGNGAQNYVCRHPVWRLYEVFSKFSILHYSSCFKLIPMILTLQCHLFDHTICNGNSTLYSKMGRILSISWGNGAQNYVCRHPLWRYCQVFSKFSIRHYSSCFKLIPMILTLQWPPI